MKKIRIFFTAVIGLLAAISLQAQNLTITGSVSDPDGEPLVGAAVIVDGTSNGVITDHNGAYSLKAPANAVLNVTFIGFSTQQIPVEGRSVINVVLSPDQNILDETIIVAYGTSTRGSFTGSASTMKADVIEKRQVSNVTNALSGAVSGVQTTSSNGQPGTSSTVRIRGFGSINAGMAPLYVVDGLPYDGDISAINTQDIESMTVLKDAASAALYGARGANGVILITTKKGARTGDAVVNLEARVGVNSRGVKNYNVMTQTGTYMEKLYEAYYNAGAYNLNYDPATANAYANSNIMGGGNKALGYPVYTVPDGQNLFGLNGKINPAATLGYNDGTYFYTPDNWANETFHNQMRQEYNLSVAGGNDRLSYYVSGGYLNDGGVIVGSGFERITARVAADYQAKKWLKIGTNISFTNYTSRYPDEQTSTSSSGNAFFIANFIAPVYPLYVRDKDGNIMMNGNDKVFDYGDGKTTTYTRNWMNIANPLGDLTYRTEEYKSDILNGKYYATVTPLKGLNITATLGSYIDNTRLHYASSTLYGQSANYGGEAEQQLSRTSALTEQVMANYKLTFADTQHLDFTAVYEGYQLNMESFYAYGQNLYQEGVWAVNNTIDQKRGGGSVTEYATQGFIGRINYDDNETFFLSASFRRDASSRFAPENRWGNFWSVSGAYLINKEKYFNADWVDMLKLKASFGQQGNDSIGNYYAYLDQYSMSGSDGVFSDSTLSYKGNRELTWETTNAFNVGLDFDFFSGRIAGSLEYFNRTSKDMLYYKPVATSNGYSSIPTNIGSLRNSGVEIELSTTLFRTKNFSWEINGNFTYINNKILKLAPELEGELIDGSYIYQEGKSRYQMYLVKYAGVNPDNGMALYWAKGDDPATEDVVEDTEYKTSDWSVAYDTNRQATGDLAAKIYGGFGTTLTAYGFDFSVQFAYQAGGRLYDSGYARLMHGGTTNSSGQNWHMDILKSWSPENPDTDIPRVDSADRYASSQSDRWLTSSNYLSLNNITLGYTIPQKWTNKIKIQQIRLYATGDNLFIWSARQGLDPRQSVTSATTATYTALRTISGGVKITF